MQHARIQEFPCLLGLDCEVREPVNAPLIRAVVDLPVDQPAIAGKPDAAGADASQRKGDLVRPPSMIGIRHILHS